ncbi:MAG: hypothetical protein CVU05_07210 [Bacteroidetes bacterium HGW-Bacteroidetes-21]|jgi:signal transduction histidine kinase|nr:MAG: hypothetical protein CVU05_07210 [Bacteroidetes bacterium HGW-Bacteroidetes-21]
MNLDFVKTYNGLQVKMFYATVLIFTIRYIVVIGYNISNDQDILTIINSISLAIIIGNLIFLFRNTKYIKFATLILVYNSVISIFLSLSLNISGATESIYLARDLIVINILILITAFMTDRLNTLIFTLVLITLFLTLKPVFGIDIYSAYIYLILFFIVAGFFIYSLLANLIESTVKMSMEAKLKIEELSNFKNKITQFLFHDLKVPVNSIIELNAHENNSNCKKTVHYAETIKRQLEDVLDIERLEEPELTIKKEKILFSSILHKAVLSVEVLAIQKNIRVNYDLFNLGYLYCDGNIIERVIINLLFNAVKYSHNNTEISIQVTNKADICVISVKDQGLGIKKEHLNKVFDKYFKVEPGLSKNTSSNGLGLTFCKLAVNAHKGTIRVTSSENSGSEFIIELPGYSPSIEKAIPLTITKNEIIFSGTEKEKIKDICVTLLHIPIYKMGEIIPILQSLEKIKIPKIQQWVEILTHAVYSGNQEYFKALLNQVLENDGKSQ